MQFSETQKADLRDGFKLYLKKNHPHYSDSYVRDQCSWAFFVYDHISQAVFFDALTSERGMADAKNAVMALADNGGVRGRGVKKPSNYTSSYINTLKLFRDFINHTYGGIHNYRL